MSTILITGCSTGIGFATAEVLARSGHTVYATMRNPQRSPELSELAGKDDLPIIVLPMDVDSDESVKATIADVITRAGKIDVLINNAGIFRLGAVEELPLSAFQEVMETNYFGTIRCIQAVLPSMRENGAGCIVNVTSVSGKIYGIFQGTYAASKAATEAFSESLAAEVQPFGIRVVLVEPGVIDTPILDKIESPPVDTKYPIMNRVNAFFSASQDNHVSPGLVGETIRDILADNSTQMRYPVGPDSALLLGWRASLSDYEWISSGNVDEETWIAGMGQLGLDVRPYLPSASV